jgi:hypothetical protein
MFVAVLLALSTPSFAARRRLLSVDLRGDADAPWLSITTDGPPNFTSFKLNHPTRVVVDFPETSGAATKQNAPGLIAAWTVESIGSDDRVVTRLTVELRSDADYRLISNGSVVELRLQRATARPLVALESDRPSASTFDGGAPAVAVAEAPPVDAPAAAAPVETPPPLALPTPPTPPPMTPAERARAERARQLEARREALAALAEKKRKAADERKAREEALREAARLKREAKLKAQREALALAVEKKRKATEERQARAAALLEEKRRAVAAAKARAAEKLKQQIAEAAAAKAKRAEQARLARERAATLAAARAQRLKEQQEEAARIRALRPAVLGQIGFRRVGHDAEILIHTSAPVTYAMHEAAPDKLVLSLERTRITVPNNRRALDARWFGTPVVHIAPHEDLKELRVDIEIDLATPAAPYEIKQGANSTLTVVFHSLLPVRAEAHDGTGLTSAP